MKSRMNALICILLIILGTLVPQMTCAQSEESQLKGVFVLNFAKLTEMPAEVRTESTTYTISILGKMPSAGFINILKGQSVHGANVIIRHIENPRQAKDSQLLYITDSEYQRLPAILKEVSQFPVLTVSDIPGFAEAGGMIGLLPVQSRLGFEVNITAVRKARLSVSSQVLKLARVVYGL